MPSWFHGLVILRSFADCLFGTIPLSTYPFEKDIPGMHRRRRSGNQPSLGFMQSKWKVEAARRRFPLCWLTTKCIHYFKM